LHIVFDNLTHPVPNWEQSFPSECKTAPDANFDGSNPGAKWAGAGAGVKELEVDKKKRAKRITSTTPIRTILRSIVNQKLYFFSYIYYKWVEVDHTLLPLLLLIYLR
jgi:hypothetical protein